MKFWLELDVGTTFSLEIWDVERYPLMPGESSWNFRWLQDKILPFIFHCEVSGAERGEWGYWSNVISTTQELDFFHSAILSQGDTGSPLLLPLSRFLWLFLSIGILKNQSYPSHVPSRRVQMKPGLCQKPSAHNWWLTNAKIFKGEQVLKVFYFNDYVKRNNQMSIWIFLLNSNAFQGFEALIWWE